MDLSIQSYYNGLLYVR